MRQSMLQRGSSSKPPPRGTRFRAAAATSRCSTAVAEEKGEAPAQTAAECTVDLPIEAHIPESYIDATTVRLDVYRLIADIRSDEDASDVTDELIDRFGDPPASVMGLIRVALARNRATLLGITEIGALPGRVMLSAGAKTYLTVRPEKKLSVIDNVTNILEAFASELKKVEESKGE